MTYTKIIEQVVKILETKYLPYQEFYFILASFIIYFCPTLNTETWNTFHTKILDGSINLEKGLFLTDEEKNPEFFNKMGVKEKKILKRKLCSLVLISKRELEKNYGHLYKSHRIPIVCIADTIERYGLPTFFPEDYIKNQITIHKKYTNELTGHPLSWEFVDSLKNNTYSFDKICNTQNSTLLPPAEILKLIKRELNQFYKNTKKCMICNEKCPTPPYKSVQNYRVVFFCSLTCMENWNIDEV